VRFGIIDCGTNTIHLLIAEAAAGGQFRVLHKERNYARLGQEGLHRIGEASFRRGLDCIVEFGKMLASHGVSQVRVFGTEALRRASNGAEFAAAVHEAAGIPVHIISGAEEARLIHLGVMQAVPPFSGKALIMDIGGGSVEFIICSQDEVFWAQSFPIGVQVLFSAFQKNDPISQGDLAAIEMHLEEVLQPLLETLKHHETPLLLGASGSFEVLEDFLVKNRYHPLFSVIGVDDYHLLHRQMIRSSKEERRNMPKLPPERIELIVVAFVLIEFVLRRAGIRQIITSAYAMKEGILREMLEEHRGTSLD
jgi:exopolyphosphatase/guanosine-5'-triphosphate,3'-diphosphate pyrophosphatase